MDLIISLTPSIFLTNNNLLFLRNETVNNGNARRDKKQGKKAPERNALNHNRSDGALPDLGALCI